MQNPNTKPLRLIAVCLLFPFLWGACAEPAHLAVLTEDGAEEFLNDEDSLKETFAGGEGETFTADEEPVLENSIVVNLDDDTVEVEMEEPVPTNSANGLVPVEVDEDGDSVELSSDAEPLAIPVTIAKEDDECEPDEEGEVQKVSYKMGGAVIGSERLACVQDEEEDAYFWTKQDHLQNGVLTPIKKKGKTFSQGQSSVKF